MIVRLDLSAWRQTKWQEYAVRFIFGGAVTVFAGLVAARYGPGIGGIFLAFPAILPASATLLEKHERNKKEKAGLTGRRRGRLIVALDASGAALGGCGLLLFALLVWSLSPRLRPWIVLPVASIAWLIASSLVWRLRRFPRRWTRRHGGMPGP